MAIKTMVNPPTQLLMKRILERGPTFFPEKKITTRTPWGMHRYTYNSMYERVCRLANVLEGLGVERGDVIGTLGWNHFQQGEIFFAVPCIGAVLHTLNLRLFGDYLVYQINQAEDKVIFLDYTEIPIVESIKDRIPSVKAFVIMMTGDKLPETELLPVHSYEDLISRASPDYSFPDMDENTPAALMYTTATTGMPKGCLYSHRMLYLDYLTSSLVDAGYGINEKDTVMCMTPMYHVLGWGLTYLSQLCGANQVYAGIRPTARDFCNLIQGEKVTWVAGVPTVLMDILALQEKEKIDLGSLRSVMSSGSLATIPEAKGYAKLGIYFQQPWGMTETGPLACLNILRADQWETLSEEQRFEKMVRNGYMAPGVEWKVVSPEGREIKWDGKERGELLVRGLWLVNEYFKDSERSAETWEDGWMHTKDVVTVDERGSIQVCDRLDDMIKSGGEWISSLDVENTLIQHPQVAEACVVAMPHPRWEQRPYALIVPKDKFRGEIEEGDIRDFLKDKMAKTWTPDIIEFVDEIPKTAVGKFDKKLLRQKVAEKAEKE